jgi:hypothetical protein
VGEQRASATPRDLEDKGDFLTRATRFLRNILAWFLGLFGIAVGAESTLQGTLTEAQSAAAAVSNVSAWARGNAWIMLVFAGLVAVIVLELTRQRRAKDYREFNYQGPNGGAQQ